MRFINNLYSRLSIADNFEQTIPALVDVIKHFYRPWEYFCYKTYKATKNFYHKSICRSAVLSRSTSITEASTKVFLLQSAHTMSSLLIVFKNLISQHLILIFYLPNAVYIYYNVTRGCFCHSFIRRRAMLSLLYRRIRTRRKKSC